MSNKETGTPVNVNGTGPDIVYGGGYFYLPSQAQMLEGKLLTLAETLGLKDTQEKAYKDMVRNQLWEFYSNAKWVGKELATQIMVDQFGNQSVPNFVQPLDVN